MRLVQKIDIVLPDKLHVVQSKTMGFRAAFADRGVAEDYLVRITESQHPQIKKDYEIVEAIKED